jgi:hypothetical protein
VYSVSGTLVVGTGNFKDIANESKTINGVGNAYGDSSNINMNPRLSSIIDPDETDMAENNIGKYPSANLYPMSYSCPWEGK